MRGVFCMKIDGKAWVSEHISGEKGKNLNWAWGQLLSPEVLMTTANDQVPSVSVGLKRG